VSPGGSDSDAPDDDRRWLTRLSFGDWMRAALNELDQAYAALRGKQHREGLTHARRAAGMGVNAWLVVADDARYGRTYTEHLRALAGDSRVADEARAAARRLLDAPARPELVTLGPGPVELADAAKTILVWIADRLPAE
jgi:HEPN domain-containing protein